MGSKSPGRAPVSASEAAKNFGRLIDRVRETGATYVVERSGRPVARIGPAEAPAFTIADLRRLVASNRRADEAYLTAVERAASRHSRPRVRRNPWGR